MIVINPAIEKTQKELSMKLREFRRGQKQWLRKYEGFDPRDYVREDGIDKLVDEIDALRCKLRALKAEAGMYDEQYRVMSLRPSPDDEWRVAAVDGLGNYEVSKEGFIRNRRTGTLYKRSVDGRRLWVSLLAEDGRTVRLRLDKIVAATWLPDAPSAYLAAKNGDTLDCRAENLRWVR